jgi:hypothetical protein
MRGLGGVRQTRNGLRTALVVTSFVAAACTAPVTGAPHSTGTAAGSPVAPSTSPTATPRQYVVAVWASSADTVLFQNSQGSTVGQAKVPRTTAAIAAAAGQLWYIDTDKHLRAVGVDGHVSDMGVIRSLAVPGAVAYGLAVSEDGHRWAWGGCVACAPSAGDARARIYAGGIDIPDRLVLDEPTSNPVLLAIGFAPSGIVVARSATGIGGCCYIPPEAGHKDVVVVNPTTMQVSQSLTGCVAAYASPQGSFVCTSTSALTVHLADGLTRSVTPMSPVVGVGWAHVDDTHSRVVFTVIHSRGPGDGGCPCMIDVESAPLDGGSVTVLANQMTLDDVLPDGGIVATTAPSLPGQGTAATDWVVRPDGSRVQIGQAGAQFLAVLQLT